MADSFGGSDTNAQRAHSPLSLPPLLSGSSPCTSLCDQCTNSAVDTSVAATDAAISSSRQLASLAMYGDCERAGRRPMNDVYEAVVSDVNIFMTSNPLSEDADSILRSVARSRIVTKIHMPLCDLFANTSNRDEIRHVLDIYRGAVITEALLSSKRHGVDDQTSEQYKFELDKTRTMLQAKEGEQQVTQIDVDRARAELEQEIATNNFHRIQAESFKAELDTKNAQIQGQLRELKAMDAKHQQASYDLMKAKDTLENERHLFSKVCLAIDGALWNFREKHKSCFEKNNVELMEEVLALCPRDWVNCQSVLTIVESFKQLNTQGKRLKIDYSEFLYQLASLKHAITQADGRDPERETHANDRQLVIAVAPQSPKRDDSKPDQLHHRRLKRGKTFDFAQLTETCLTSAEPDESNQVSHADNLVSHLVSSKVPHVERQKGDHPRLLGRQIPSREDLQLCQARSAVVEPNGSFTDGAADDDVFSAEDERRGDGKTRLHGGNQDKLRCTTNVNLKNTHYELHKTKVIAVDANDGAQDVGADHAGSRSMGRHKFNRVRTQSRKHTRDRSHKRNDLTAAETNEDTLFSHEDTGRDGEKRQVSGCDQHKVSRTRLRKHTRDRLHTTNDQGTTANANDDGLHSLEDGVRDDDGKKSVRGKQRKFSRTRTSSRNYSRDRLHKTRNYSIAASGGEDVAFRHEDRGGDNAVRRPRRARTSSGKYRCDRSHKRNDGSTVADATENCMLSHEDWAPVVERIVSRARSSRSLSRKQLRDRSHSAKYSSTAAACAADGGVFSREDEGIVVQDNDGGMASHEDAGGGGAKKQLCGGDQERSQSARGNDYRDCLQIFKRGSTAADDAGFSIVRNLAPGRSRLRSLLSEIVSEHGIPAALNARKAPDASPSHEDERGDDTVEGTTHDDQAMDCPTRSSESQNIQK